MSDRTTTDLCLEFRQCVIEQTNNIPDGREFDPASILAIFDVLAKAISMFAAICNKTPPEPGPVPQELADDGVSKKAYKLAVQSQWAAKEGWNGEKFRNTAVNKAAKELAEKAGTKKKLQKPAAIAALTSAMNEDVAVLARAARDGGN